MKLGINSLTIRLYRAIGFTAICLLLGGAPVHAGYGKATAPHFQIYKDSNGNQTATTVMLTNITDHPIQVTVLFYGKDGNLITTSSYYTYDNFTSSNTQIAAKSSAFIYLAPPTNIAINYGKISVEWQNLAGNDDTVALLAHAYVYMNHSGQHSRFEVPVNNGAPF